ncbi:MAG TPA: LuxR C-terminal-related transcriptional regulator [Acidimicrobiales bacterium]|nr:LuxR C-terminal-related transcriptional regulator [Acidimicrobiales bacterium]
MAGGPRLERGPPREHAVPVLLGTKLGGPRLRSSTIERTSLLPRLASHRGPVLVVAPPGFGKSTLLGQWRQAAELPLAWVSLDAADNDPMLFWNYVVAALQAIEPTMPLTPPSGPLGEQDFVDAIVPRLLNELESLESDVGLVLDDYHAITSSACHRSVELFLTREPANVRVVVSSRVDPPFPVGTLRARGELLELREGDLAFTPQESRRFLNDALDLGLSPRAAATLHEHAEGWPAGLYLASLSLRDAADRERAVADFGGSTRQVSDYLTEVGLDALAPPVRDFLVETSILERMSGPLCDATTGRSGSADLLVELEHANLFLTALDDHREWYRYHHLFADLLRAELHRRPLERRRELHRCAFAWLADAGHVGEAIHHAVEAGEIETAARLVAENYLSTIEWGGYATVAAWLEAFPRRVVVGDARLSVVEAWVASFQRRREDAQVALQNAIDAGYEGPLPDGASSIEVTAALLRAGFPWGDVGEMLTAARRAFELEGHRDSMWRVTVHVQLGWALALAGRSDEARPLLERGATLAPRTEQWLNAVGADCLLAFLDLEAADLASAERWARRAMGVLVSQGLADTATGGWAAATLGAVLARGGDPEGERLLRLGVDRMRAAYEPLLVIQVLLALTAVLSARGAADDGRRALGEAKDLIDACTDPGVLADRWEEVGRSLAASTRSIVGGTELSKREIEILRMLATRQSQREIGRRLFVSYNTVHSHIGSIYRKLGVSSRVDAVARAREQGLLWDSSRESPG